MAELFNTTLPLDLKHEFKITNSLSVTPEVKESFTPLAMTESELKPTQAEITFKLTF